MHKYFILLFGAVLVLAFYPAWAKGDNIFGLNGHYSLLSSYYFDENAGLQQGDTVQADKKTLSNGLGFGLIWDIRYAVYSGIRLNCSFYPALNKVIEGDPFNEIMVDVGLLAKKYFFFNSLHRYNVWLAYGPTFQYMFSRYRQIDLNNYVLNITLALGGNYQLRPDLYIIPEINLGSNVLIKVNHLNRQISNVLDTTEFFTNGFTVSFKVGLGYNKPLFKGK